MFHSELCGRTHLDTVVLVCSIPCDARQDATLLELQRLHNNTHAAIGGDRQRHCLVSFSFLPIKYIHTNQMTQLRLSRTQWCDFAIQHNRPLSEKGAPQAHCCRPRFYHRVDQRTLWELSQDLPWRRVTRSALNLQNAGKTVQRLSSSECTVANTCWD